jgi:hypothetical protein
MKFVSIEQIDVSCKRPSKARQFLKKFAAKAMRRMGKQLLEDAPTKLRFRGWMS